MTGKEIENMFDKMDFKEMIALAYYILYSSGMSNDEIQKVLREASEKHFANRHTEALEAAKWLENLPGMFCGNKKVID